MRPDKTLRADARRNRQRILAAAEAVFADRGPSASTEEVAARAGVAIGTVFRHFPTKADLLREIVKELLMRLTAEIESLADEGDPNALFQFSTRLVEQAAQKRTVVLLLADEGLDVPVTESVQSLGAAMGILLDRAQRAGVIRGDIGLTEVMALLTGACEGALRAGWDSDLQRRTLEIIFDGLRPRSESLR
jgi:AcrR family transcriptional regulator